jgi:hypothetical protein
MSYNLMSNYQNLKKYHGKQRMERVQHADALLLSIHQTSNNHGDILDEI